MCILQQKWSKKNIYWPLKVSFCKISAYFVSFLLFFVVMRLTRPTLSSCLPVTCDSKDLPGNLLNEVLQKDPVSVKGTETLCAGQFLLLPQSPVNIYLGETFSSYICVYNEAGQTVNNISVKVRLVYVCFVFFFKKIVIVWFKGRFTN